MVLFKTYYLRIGSPADPVLLGPVALDCVNQPSSYFPLYIYIYLRLCPSLDWSAWLNNLITLKSTLWWKWKWYHSSYHQYYWSSISRHKIIDLLFKMSWANEYLRLEIQLELCSKIQANGYYLTDYILYLLKAMFPKISHKDNIIETKPPNTSNICFLSLTTCAISEDMDCIKLQDKSTNN